MLLPDRARALKTRQKSKSGPAKVTLLATGYSVYVHTMVVGLDVETVFVFNH